MPWIDWFPSLAGCTHIPDQRDPMARYYSYHSNLSGGLRQKVNQEVLIPLKSRELLYETPHLLVRLPVEFNL